MIRSPRTCGRAASALALSLVVASGVAACGTTRSPEAFCSVMDKHKDRYLEAMAKAQGSVEQESAGGLLTGMAQAVTALGDLQRMWEELAEVAPTEIQGDVETVRDANAKQLESAKEVMDDPLKALAGSLIDGLMNSGSIQRIDTYTKAHCS